MVGWSRTPERGRQVIRVLRGEIDEIEREWSAHLGTGRYGQLRDSLYELARWLGMLG